MPDVRLIERWLPIAALGVEKRTGTDTLDTVSCAETACTSGGPAGRWLPRGRPFWPLCYRRMPIRISFCTRLGFMGIRWRRRNALPWQRGRVSVSDLPPMGIPALSAIRRAGRYGIGSQKTWCAKPPFSTPPLAVVACHSRALASDLKRWPTI